MKEVPLKTKAEQLSKLIIGMIRSGEWVDRLPGGDVLAKKFGVNPKTVQRALEVVEAEGWLLPAERRKARRVNPERERGKQKKRGSLLILYSMTDAKDMSVSELFHSLAKLWMKVGTTINLEIVDFAYYKEPASYLRRLVERHSADAILFYNASWQWIDVGEKMLPCFCCGGGMLEGSSVTAQGFRFRSQVDWVTRQLNDLGHDRILFAYTDAGRGIRDEVLGLGFFPGRADMLSGRPEDYCVRVKEDHPEVWRQVWEREFARLRPTAVMVMEAHHLLSLYAFCARKGLRIPQDLSIVSLAEFEGLNWLEPPITHAQFPYSKVLSYFEKWLKAGLKPMGFKEVEMKWVVTGSIGRVPRG